MRDFINEIMRMPQAGLDDSLIDDGIKYRSSSVPWSFKGKLSPGFSIYKGHRHPFDDDYVIRTDDGEVAAFLTTEPYKFRGKSCLQCSSIGVKKAFRGLHLARMLYEWLLAHGEWLVSDDVQTPGGVALWRYIASLPTVEIYMIDEDGRASEVQDINDAWKHNDCVLVAMGV